MQPSTISPQSVDSGVGSRGEFDAVGQVRLACPFAGRGSEALRYPTPRVRGRGLSGQLSRHTFTSLISLAAKNTSQIRR